MDTDRLVGTAKYIVARNVPATVAAVVLHWDEAHSLVALRYYMDAPPTEGESEMCELAIGELIADVWHSVENASTFYLVGGLPSALEPSSWAVYQR